MELAIGLILPVVKLQNLTAKTGNAAQKSVCLDFFYSDF